jgi:uncharacterized protein (DUF1330 family)
MSKTKTDIRRIFLPKAQANTKEFGGKYIAGGFNKAISFAGSPPPTRVVLLQFPDMDALKAFEDKEQKNIAEVGSKLASFRIIGSSRSDNDGGDGPRARGPSAFFGLQQGLVHPAISALGVKLIRRIYEYTPLADPKAPEPGSAQIGGGGG